MSLAASTKTPGFSLSEIFGGPGTSSGAASERTLVIGNLIASDITATMNTSGSTTSAAVTSAGTVAVATPTIIFSPEDAAVKFGRGSEVHRDAVAFFAQSRTGTLWGVAPAESAGARASLVITPTLGTLAAGTIRLRVCGVTLEIPVASTDTVPTLGLAMAQAINNTPELPVTAVNVWATGAVTLSAKHPGPRGNYITVSAELLSATASVRTTSTGLAVTLFGLTLTLSGGAAAGGSYRLSGGTTDDNWTNALAAVAAQRFDRISAPAYLVAGSPSANHARLADHVDTYGGLPRMFGQQALLGCAESFGNATTVATALNRVRTQVPWLRYPDALPGEIAAQVAAARLVGDEDVPGVTNGIPGESTTPAANLNWVELATLAPPDTLADQLSGTEIEVALNTGLSPVAPSPDRPGRCALVASVTSRAMANGVPDFSVYKTGNVTVLDRVRDEIVRQLRVTYRGCKLAPDRSDGRPPERIPGQPATVTPKIVRAFVLGLLRGFQRLGWIIQVEERASELTAAINASNNRRLDMNIPCTPNPDFDIGTGDLRQLSPILS